MYGRAFAALVMLSGCSHDTPLPSIAADLPTDDVRQAEAEFNRRVVREFPLGTPVGAVRTRFKADGFDAGESGADLIRKHFPCETKWSVRWQSASGKITAIHGIYGLMCP